MSFTAKFVIFPVSRDSYLNLVKLKIEISRYISMQFVSQTKKHIKIRIRNIIITVIICNFVNFFQRHRFEKTKILRLVLTALIKGKVKKTS